MPIRNAYRVGVVVREGTVMEAIVFMLGFLFVFVSVYAWRCYA